jgi:hypothetical protein
MRFVVWKKSAPIDGYDEVVAQWVRQLDDMVLTGRRFSL